MKKIVILSLIALTGCAYRNVSVEYKQVGTTCEYTETYGIVELGGEKVGEVRTVKYPNTQCSKVVDSDLKNATNKSLVK